MNGPGRQSLRGRHEGNDNGLLEKHFGVVRLGKKDARGGKVRERIVVDVENTVPRSGRR